MEKCIINHRIWYQISHTHRPKLEGRIIRYAILDDDDDEETPRMFDSEFTFEGHDLGTLKETLKKLTGIEEDVHICATNHVNNKLFPLTLQLPPNNLPMGIVVVKSSSKCKYSSKLWKWIVICTEFSTNQSTMFLIDWDPLSIGLYSIKSLSITNSIISEMVVSIFWSW